MNGLDNVFIGKIYDIELVFIHYKSFDDARVKWNRRKKRVNYSNIIIKFNDQNEFKEEDFDGFINCPYKNKVFFTSNCRYKGRPNVFYVKKYEKIGFALDDIHTKFKFKEYVNNIERK